MSNNTRVVDEANFLWPKIFNPSGRDLLIFLALLLLIGATLTDFLLSHGQEHSLLLPLLLSAFISAALGYGVVPLLQRLKTGQIIREDGPQSHLKKAGTPTMGGIFFVPIGVVVALFWSGFAPEVIAACLVTIGYAGIGWIDDWQVLQRKSNKGISPRMKLVLQIVICLVFCLWMFLTQPDDITIIKLPFLVLPLGLLFWPLAGFVLVAESNATNLTDGVDGLAGGTAAIAFLGLGILVAPNYPSLTIFCASLSGACLGFVVHNRNKASVFMGDTGSLALGPALATVGLLTANLWSLFIISGIFFIESLSVIAQVSYYKATKGPDGKGKRLFKMAPIHHHLELSGWKETQIVGAFYCINAGLVVLALAIQ